MTDKLGRVLRAMAGRLNSADVRWGIGGSLLLYFYGILDQVNDIDILVCERDWQTVTDVLNDMGRKMPIPPSDRFTSRYFAKYEIDNVGVDAICGFSIHRSGAVHPLPFDEMSPIRYAQYAGEQIPLTSLMEWQAAYDWMERPEKAALAQAYLEQNGEKLPGQ